MRRSSWLIIAVFGVVLFLWTSALPAQQSCPAPPVPPPPKNNIFSEEQENHLGDAITEQMERDFRVIADDEIRTDLVRIGERLLRQIPPTSIGFQFFLVDLPFPNAFALPGGRIYVTRKLVAAARSEDELAGVVAHEIGHAVARDSAVAASLLFREVLQVTSVGDRQDIYQKIHLLNENAMRRPKAFERVATGHSEQTEADQLGLHIMARAGYSPERYIEFWDRITETRGRRGNWLTDLFGATRPESRRLREMLRTLASLPSECVTGGGTFAAQEFEKWQAAVVAYVGLGLKESVPGLVQRKHLDPPLRTDVTHLRFSPNGNYILAQDEAGIAVLNREPFQPRFHIHAPEASPAQFTPDSRQVVFHNAALRVESWDVEEERLSAAHEIALTKPCLQTLLSPDGKHLACYGMDYDLNLIHVESASSVHQVKNFYKPNPFELLLGLGRGELDIHLVRMGFSRDGRYFLAVRDSRVLALDLSRPAPLSLPASLKRLASGGFAFLDGDRIVGVNREKLEKSGVARFPSGEVLSEFPLGAQALAAPGRGEYLLLRPISNYPVGIMSLETQKLFMGNKNSAIDIHDGVFVVEYVTGELALHAVNSREILARTSLPRSNLGTIRAMAVSDDLAWLAVSQRSRGAVWDLVAGQRILHMRGFRGAHFAGDVLYADFPPFQDAQRMIGQVSLSRRLVLEGPKLTDPGISQCGSYLVQVKPSKPGDWGRNLMLEVRDARNAETVWSRVFPRDVPAVMVNFGDETLALLWTVTQSHAREAIEADPVLRQRLGAVKGREGDLYMEMIRARDGKVLGSLLVETGMHSFRVLGAFVHGDWVVLADSNNRVLIYSLSTKELKGRVFGVYAAATAAGSTGLLAVQNAPGKMTLYDLATMEKGQELSFASPVALARFSDDGRRLLVLTGSQMVYWIDVAASTAALAMQN